MRQVQANHPDWNTGSEHDVEGLGVGMLTGVLGAGGGFLIVPVLATLGGLPMHAAVGTSLLVIALNAGSEGSGAKLPISSRASNRGGSRRAPAERAAMRRAVSTMSSTRAATSAAAAPAPAVAPNRPS